MRVLVTYDIASDTARARTAAILQQWGDRAQRSVFLCELAAQDLDEAMGQIQRLIDPQVDAVMAVPLCATCHRSISFEGQFHEPEDSSCWIVL